LGETLKNNGLGPPPAPTADTISENFDVPRRGSPDAAQNKRSLSPEVLRNVADEVKSSFVRALGKPQLVLIEIDPYRLHAFWTVTRDALELARNRLGAAGADASMVLRVFEAETDDMESSEAPAFDVDVGGLQSRSYVDIFGETRRYRAALGLRAGDNRFVTLATSNTVELPPASPNGASEILRIDMGNPESGTFAPDPADSNPEASAFFPLVSEAPDGHPGPTADSTMGTTALGAEAPGGRPPLVLEQALTSSSYGLGRAGGFEISAELHVFGHAEPDRELRLFGQKIPMRPDGSFSIRRLLPNDPTLIEALLTSDDSPTDRGDG